MSLAEIEAAIKKLPKEELTQFDQWYQDFVDDQWDEQIREDVRSGKLDSLRAELRKAEDSGTMRAAIEVGLESLKNEPTVTVAEARQKVAQWAGKVV